MAGNIFEYTIFDNVSIAMSKARYFSLLKKELKSSGLSLPEQVKFCDQRKKELEQEIPELERETLILKSIRDSAVDAWIEEYGTGDEKNDTFDAFDSCSKEDKAFEKALKELHFQEGAIEACNKAITRIHKEMAKQAAKNSRR